MRHASYPLTGAGLVPGKSRHAPAQRKGDANYAKDVAKVRRFSSGRLCVVRKAPSHGGDQVLSGQIDLADEIRRGVPLV